MSDSDILVVGAGAKAAALAAKIHAINTLHEKIRDGELTRRAPGTGLGLRVDQQDGQPEPQVVALSTRG